MQIQDARIESLKTFDCFKVVWKYIAIELTCAVIGSHTDARIGEKVVIPDCKLMLVPCDNENEAHYVCAVLNSSISRFIVASYAVGTQLSTHILENIKVPKYDPKNELHQDLSRLSEQCHEKVAIGITVSDFEDQIDELAAELWGVEQTGIEGYKSESGGVEMIGFGHSYRGNNDKIQLR